CRSGLKFNRQSGPSTGCAARDRIGQQELGLARAPRAVCCTLSGDKPDLDHRTGSGSVEVSMMAVILDLAQRPFWETLSGLDCCCCPARRWRLRRYRLITRRRQLYTVDTRLEPNQSLPGK
ncbi:unnamed protein product, partial [Mycena citricolor]